MWIARRHRVGEVPCSIKATRRGTPAMAGVIDLRIRTVGNPSAIDRAIAHPVQIESVCCAHCQLLHKLHLERNDAVIGTDVVPIVLRPDLPSVKLGTERILDREAPIHAKGGGHRREIQHTREAILIHNMLNPAQERRLTVVSDDIQVSAVKGWGHILQLLELHYQAGAANDPPRRPLHCSQVSPGSHCRKLGNRIAPIAVTIGARIATTVTLITLDRQLVIIRGWRGRSSFRIELQIQLVGRTADLLDAGEDVAASNIDPVRLIAQCGRDTDTHSSRPGAPGCTDSTPHRSCIGTEGIPDGLVTRRIFARRHIGERNPCGAGRVCPVDVREIVNPGKRPTFGVPFAEGCKRGNTGSRLQIRHWRIDARQVIQVNQRLSADAFRQPEPRRLLRHVAIEYLGHRIGA